jgi:hypothetical protein
MIITVDVEQIILPGLPLAHADATGRAVIAATRDGMLCHFSVDVDTMAAALMRKAADPEIEIDFNITNTN